VFINCISPALLIYLPTQCLLLCSVQVDLCKRVLNIYRYLVMNIKLLKTTWFVVTYICSVISSHLPVSCSTCILIGTIQIVHINVNVNKCSHAFLCCLVRQFYRIEFLLSASYETQIMSLNSVHCLQKKCDSDGRNNISTYK